MSGVRFEVWEIVVLVAAWLALVALAVFGHLRFWVRGLALPVPYASHERLRCEDGALIELRRVPIPESVPRAELPPVVLVHGLPANHRNQDMHPDHSLARHLAAIGRDVWLPTLRSGVPRLMPGHRIRFDAMVQNDLPCVIDAVLARTSAPQLDYVGFSMGGMLIYAALDVTVARSKIRRVVTVGSPAEVKPRIPVPRVLRFVPWWLTPKLPFRFLARLFAFASEWFTTPLHAWVLNPKNVAPGVTRLALVDCIEDVPAGLIFDFMRWSSTDGVVRALGEPILPRLETMDMPALFVAGSADYLAPPRAVRHAFDAWGKQHGELPKRFVIVGRDYGAIEDYGHGDLALGARVGVELFAPIARFLGPEEQEAEAHGPRLGEAARRDIDRRHALEDAREDALEDALEDAREDVMPPDGAG